MEPIDKVVFGDNQFFGINHMSQDKAQAQAERFHDIEGIFDVYRMAFDAGIRAVMLNSNDRAREICERFRSRRSEFPALSWYPSIPYPHKYANLVGEKGILPAIKSVLFEDTSAMRGLGALTQGGMAVLSMDAIRLMRMLVDLEMRSFQGLEVRSVFLQNVITDLILGLGLKDFFHEYCEHVRRKFGAAPGFITQNLPFLRSRLADWGISGVVVCASINKIGYLMSPGVSAYREALAQNDPRSCQVMAMSTLASGAIPAREAYEFINGLNIQSVVFGASSKRNIDETVRLIRLDGDRQRPDAGVAPTGTAASAAGAAAVATPRALAVVETAGGSKPSTTPAACKVLVTGGAGFIGSRLALALLERGYTVTVLDNLHEQIHSAQPEESPLYRSIAGKVRFIRADVTDRAALEQALAGQDCVVHFAAETGTGQSMYQIDRYSRVNVGGTALLLDLLANGKHGVRRVVVASSRAVYGEGKYLSAELGVVYPGHRAAADMSGGDFEVKFPGCRAPLKLLATDEESKLHPSSVYGITKQVQEQMVMTVCPTLGIEPVAFRYQNVYGPGQSLSNPYTGILSIFSNLIMGGQAINIFEDGRESRDFVFVDDVVRATILGLEVPAAARQVFNVGSGVATDVMTVARTLARELGREVPIQVSGNFRLGDIRHNFACLERARAVLGFEPRVGFDAGIAQFAAWVRSMGSVDSGYERSIAEMRSKGLLK